MLEPVRELSERRYSAQLLALVATLGATALQLALSQWLGDSLLPLTLAVILAAWYGGRAAGLTATVLGAALAAWYLLPPRHSLLVAAPVDRVQLLVLVLVGLLVSRVCEAFHATRRRLEAERARLRESAAFHGAIADLATDFAFTARVEADGSIVPEAVTEGFTALLGYQLGELTRGGGWSRLLHPDDAERARARTRELLRGHTVDSEARLVARDGRVVLLQHRVRPLWDERGRVVRVYGACRDVTRERQAEQELLERERQLREVMAEQRRGQEELRESEARFRQMTEAMPQIAFATGPDGSIDYVNSQWYRYSGRPADESFGLGWMQVLHPEDYAEAYRKWTHALRSGEPFETEYRFRGADGGFRWHLCRALPVRDGAGRVQKWVGTSTDVHEQRRLTGQLEEERGLLDAVFATSPVGLAVVDRELRFLRVNGVLAALDGVPAAEHAGRPAREVAPSLWQALEAAHRQVLGGGEPVTNHEIAIAPADAPEATRHWLASCYPIRTAGGVVGVGTAVVDVTEQRRTRAALERSEEALRAADRRKDEFLATLAHELRNPLNPIRSAVEVLRLKGRSDPEQDWSRGVIERQVHHLTRLIDDLLDVSRISRGKLELRRQPVELGEVIRGAIEASRPLIQQQQHELAVDLPREELYLDGDVVRLTQVFMNLLNNAAKYTDRGGRVSVVAARDGAEVAVVVADTGVGIAPEKLPHLFEMFYQVDRSLERAQGGLGIGLSLVKQLVAMHGGRIGARSAGVGRGSEFVVRLPLQAPAQAVGRRAELPSRARAEAGRPRRILVVDDNVDSAASLALVLQLAGHSVDTAGDGEEALGKAARDRPEVVLLDLGMPKLNGYEVCRRLRAQSWGARLVLIAQTGWGQDEDRRRTREAGFDAHVVKPVDPAALGRLIPGPPAERDAGGERPRVH